VFPPVLQHVDQSVPDFSRSIERAHVIPVSPHAPAPTEDAVDSLGESDREALDAPGERAVVLRLDDEVKVIALDGELKNPKAATRSQ